MAGEHRSAVPEKQPTRDSSRLPSGKPLGSVRLPLRPSLKRNFHFQFPSQYSFLQRFLLLQHGTPQPFCTHAHLGPAVTSPPACCRSATCSPGRTPNSHFCKPSERPGELTASLCWGSKCLRTSSPLSGVLLPLFLPLPSPTPL